MESTALSLASIGASGLTYADPAAVAAAESVKAEIQSAYVMALKKPRNEQQSRVNILSACRRPQFADKVEYCKPVGGQRIMGPSIRFAELALREWGNIRSTVQTVYEDDAIRRVKVTVTDMQTNSCFGKDIQINKTVERKKSEGREVVGERTNSYGDKVFIVKATEDELANKEAAAVSKVLRNEGLRLIPIDVIDESLKAARETLSAGDNKDPKAAINAVVDSFAKIGVQPTELERYLGHSLSGVSPHEILELRNIWTTIKDGEAKWTDFLEVAEGGNPEEKPEDTASKRARGKLVDLKNRVMKPDAPPHNEKTGEVSEPPKEQPAEDKPPFDTHISTNVTAQAQPNQPPTQTAPQNGNGRKRGALI